MSETGALPQYQQVADTLRRRIRDGAYCAGDTLPSAAELERAFSVSNITIRKACEVLAREGLIEGRRGVGTVVMEPTQPAEIEVSLSGNFAEWLDTASGEKQAIEQEVLSLGVVPAPHGVARWFALEAGADLWCMRRLRRTDGHAISLHINYGREADFGFISVKTMAKARSFVDVMRRDCPFVLAQVEQRVAATTADRDLTELLEVSYGAPIFRVENVYSTVDEEVAAVSHLFLRGDRYTYRASIKL